MIIDLSSSGRDRLILQAGQDTGIQTLDIYHPSRSTVFFPSWKRTRDQRGKNEKKTPAHHEHHIRYVIGKMREGKNEQEGWISGP